MAEDIIKNTCSNCLFYSNSSHIMGECRRFPTYQNRHSSEWCGEHQQNPAIQVIDNIVDKLTNENVVVQSKIKVKAGRSRKYA